MAIISVPATFVGRLRLAWKLLCKNLTQYLLLTFCVSTPNFIWGGLAFSMPELFTGYTLFFTIGAFVITLSITMVMGIGALLHLTQTVLHKQRTTTQAALLAGVRNFWLYARVLLRTCWYLLWPLLVAEIAWILIFIAVGIGLGTAHAMESMTVAIYLMLGLLACAYLGLTLWRMPPVILALPMTQQEKIKSANVVLAKAIHLTYKKWWPALGNTLGAYLITILPIMGTQIIAGYLLPPMDAITLMFGQILVSSVPSFILMALFYLVIYITFLHLKSAK